MSLAKIRDDINEIDMDIVLAVSKRMSIVKKVAAYKKQNNIPVVDPKREGQVICLFEKESLKTLGELLSNDTSRKIIKVLIEDEMYVNQISIKLGITPNLVTHHLKKLEVLGLVNVISKPISKKTKNHNFYKIRNDIFVDLKPREGKLKRVFKEGIKFAGIVFLGVASSILLNNFSTDGQWQNISDEYSNLPYLIVIIGLAIWLFFEKRKGSDF